jgi:hypothetical protein
MHYRFKKHYTREQARTLLPSIRKWLQQLQKVRGWLATADRELEETVNKGWDVGGDKVNGWVKGLCQLKKIAGEFESREIQLKDLDRGLIDFPAILGGKEVFLCWEQDEDDIEYWHDLETGYAGRERLP